MRGICCGEYVVDELCLVEGMRQVMGDFVERAVAEYDGVVSRGQAVVECRTHKLGCDILPVWHEVVQAYIDGVKAGIVFVEQLYFCE